MKRSIVFLAAALAYAASAESNSPVEADDEPLAFDATVAMDVTSGYLLYGALMNSQPCVQGGVEAGATYDALGRFGVGAWSNSDLTGRRHTFGKA